MTWCGCVGVSPLHPAHPRCAVMTSGTSRRRFPLPPRGCSSLEQALTHLSCSGRTYPVVSGGGPLLTWQHQVSQCHQLVDNCWMAKGLLRVLSAWMVEGLLRVLSAWMVEGSAVGVLVLVYRWHSSLWVRVWVRFAYVLRHHLCSMLDWSSPPSPLQPTATCCRYSSTSCRAQVLPKREGRRRGMTWTLSRPPSTL